MQWHSSTTTHLCTHTTIATSQVMSTHNAKHFKHMHKQTGTHAHKDKCMQIHTYNLSHPSLCLLPHTHAHTYHTTHKHSHHNPKCLSSSFDTCRIHTQRCKHFTALRTIAARTTHTEEQSTYACDKRPLLCSTSDELTRSEMKEEGSLKTN